MSEIIKADQPKNMLQIVAKAASDPQCNPEKMMALLDVQERMMNKQAEIEFNNSMVALQSELPVIKKSGAIVMKGVTTSTYAKFEDIMKAIKPLLSGNGFAITFGTEQENQKVIITATLSHKGGYSKNARVPLSIDASGAKNNVQGVGSTISYGKRYLLGMMLNLVFEGEDDDAQTAQNNNLYDKNTIDESQIAEISSLIEQTNSDKERFLKWIGAASVEDIAESDFQKATQQLRKKL